MEIIYTCPKCGSDLQELCLPSYPPQYQKRCLNCGWVSEIEKSEIIRIPYSADITKSSIPNACRNCANHPNNGGTGVCHCTLGSITVY